MTPLPEAPPPTASRIPRLVGIAVVLLAVLLATRLRGWSAAVVAQRASEFFHRTVTVGEVTYRLLPFQVEVRDFRVAGAEPGDPPFLEVPRIVATPSLTQLVDRKVVLNQLRVEGAKIHIRAFKRGGDDIPKMGGAGGGAEVHIRRLIIEGGELWVDHQRVPLDLDVPDFRGRLTQRRPGVLAGSIALGPGPARFGDGPALPISTSAELALEGGRLVVEQARLVAEGTDLGYRGLVRLRPLAADLAVSGAVDLEIVDRHVTRTGLGLDGDSTFQGTVNIERGKLRVRGRLHGTAGRFDGIAVPRYAGEIEWNDDGVRLSSLDTEFMGGTGRFDVEVPARGGDPRVAAILDGVDAEAVSTYLFDTGSAGLVGRTSGTVDVRWPRGRARELSGRADLVFSAGDDGRTPLSGRLLWRAQGGAQTIEDGSFRTPHTRAELRGTIALDHRTDLELDARATDLASADALIVRLRRAVGNPEARVAGLGGAGVFQGRWKGTLEDPVFVGRVTAQDVSYLGVTWGKAEAAGEMDSRELRPRSLILRRDGAELWVDGHMESGYYGEEDALDVRVRLREWPAADLVQALEWDLDVDGPVSGEAVLRGRRSEPFGTTHLQSARGRYYGMSYEDAEIRSVLRGRLAEITEGRARVGGGGVSFSGTATDDGIYDGTARFEDVELSSMAPERVDASRRIGGRVSGEVVLQGPLARPRLRGDVRSARLFLGDEGLGALQARLFAGGDGTVGIDGRCRSARVDLSLKGRVGVLAPFEADLHVAAQATSLDPFVRAGFALSPRVSMVGTGEVILKGPLTDPRRLQVQVQASELLIGLPEYPVKNRVPVLLSARDGRILVERLELTGEGTDLAVTGTAPWAGDGVLALDVSGAADLRALSVLSPDLKGRGSARVAVSVAGPLTEPAVDGTLAIEGAGVRLRGFPHGLDDLRGRVRFTGKSATFEGLTGTVGGGAVELEGQAAYEALRLVSFDVRAVGRGLALRYPEGLRSVLDADLRLLGNADHQWLTGRVDVRQASYTKRYDVASELLAPSAPPAGAAAAQSGLRFDVKVLAPGTLRIDNNLAALVARAELSLQGTSNAPVVLGRAQIDRGRVYFQGNTYVIRRGSIDFANPQKIDPAFDIEAESRVRSYNVTLKVAGTLDHVYPTLTSDPPLSTVGILSLIAGADEAEVQRTFAVQTTGGQKLAATGAATLAVGRLSEEFGLERGAARLGLSRFSIDPAFVRGEIASSTPTARMTLGKRITPDLNVVYSQELGAEERLIAIEYTLSDRLSLLLTRADEGRARALGFDLRLRQTR